MEEKWNSISSIIKPEGTTPIGMDYIETMASGSQHSPAQGSQVEGIPPQIRCMDNSFFAHCSEVLGKVSVCQNYWN